MSAKPSIVIAEPERFSPGALDQLRSWADVHLETLSESDFSEAFRRYDVVWFRLGHKVSARYLAGNLRCRILATPVTGLDHIDLEACERAGVKVVSLRGETEFLKDIRGTAELTLALALTLIRRVPAAMQSVLDGAWDRDPFQGTELYGKTAGIVGVGRLGTIVARYFRALGMNVLGYDPRPFPAEVAEPADSLHDLLTRSDVVSLHVSYQSSTRQLLDRVALSRLKLGAILINTSRGGVVDEAALLEALQSGRLAGAALDVVDDEPAVGTSHPLVQYARTHDNLALTPHIGGNTVESFEKTECFLAGKVRQAWQEVIAER